MLDTPTLSPRLICTAFPAIVVSALTLAGCGSSGNTITSPSSVSKCSVAFDAPASTLPAGGGAGSIAVKTARECQWTAQPEVSWLNITAGATGQGDGSVQFNASSNSDPVARTGGVMVNGLRAQITQAAGECKYELGSSSASFPQTGGSGTADLRASSPLCTWTASSDAEWISIAGNANGKGSAAVPFTVAATTGAPRAGTLTIAGLHLNVTQSEGCTYAVSPPAYSAGAAGGSQVVTVTTGAGCPWTAASNADWITVAAAAGAGPGTLTFSVAPTSGPSRTGTLMIAGTLVTVTQSPGCSFDVTPLTHTVDPAGGTRTVNVTAAAGCAWTASSAQPWITITSGASGNGSGTVTLSIAGDNGPGRSGVVTIAGQTVTLTQGSGCSFAIAPDSRSLPASGGSSAVTVTAGAGCAWTAKSNVSWITVSSGGSGSGNGTVNLTIAATSGPGRSGTVTIAGRTFTVNQGQGCSFTLTSNSTSVPASGGSGAFDIRSGDGCGWSAASSAPWLTVISSATGSGNGTVRYSASGNTGPQRTATITAGGETFTVTQAGGCSYALTPTSKDVSSGGELVVVTVTASAGCSWTASTTDSWITISSGASGSGNGSVQLVIAQNTGAPRQGTTTVANQPFTVTQAAGCTFSIAPGSQTLPASGGPGSFNVTTAAGCPWTAAVNQDASSWLNITSGAGGTGPGSVQFAAAPNSSAARTATITAAGQTFTVMQDSGCSVSVAPDTIAEPAAGGSQNVGVTTAPECSWTASSSAPWIAITPPDSGMGNGNVQLAIQANTGPARSGTASIAGRTVTVNQETGCTVSIAPSAQPVPGGGGMGSITVTTPADCPWTATSNNTDWLTVTAGATGTGPGTVQFNAVPNTSGAPRTGTIAIGNQTFTVTQAGS
jgi:hypothetical protein